MRPLTFTAYRAKNRSRGEPHTKTWAEWCELFAKRDVREAKDGPAIILGEIAKGKSRSLLNVRAACAIGVDLEKLTDAQIEAAFEALRPFEHYVWTTHSHAPSAPRLRIVLPFADPVEPSDYPSIWAGLNALIGGVNDPSTKDISRLHFLPSCPPGAERHHRGWRNVGRFVTPDDLPDGPVAATPSSQLAADDPLMAARLAGKLRLKMAAIRTNEPIKPLVKALLEGNPLADAGGRHNAIRDLTWWVAEKTKDASPATLSELFGLSLASMRQQSPNDSPSLEEVWDAYASAVRKLRDADKRVEERRAEERRKRARDQQIAAVGSAAYYDDDDLARIAGMHGWETAELRDRWLVQREGMHWMLDASGAYRGPYSKEDAAIMASKLLARAPVRLMESTRTGTTYRPLADVTRESGQVVERVVSDMIKQRTVFDPDTLTLHEAVIPLRKLGPARFDPAIDEWLKLLAGPQYPRLIDWLSCVSDLSKLLCAVYFDGVAGSGKTLIAFGLARLWTEGPPGDIELVLSDFNDEIARCPLVLADEEIPRKYGSMTVTTKLRTILSTMSRTLKRKFKPPTDLHGCVRLVLAANNEFLLDSKDVSSAQDLDAIAQRFLYINVPQDAADLLNGMPRKVREQWATKGIALHALWLRDNHVVETPGKRFWVEGDVSQMHRLLMTGSKWNSLCCEWLCRYLMQPNLYDTSATNFIRRGDGELLVNDQALIDGWELYIKNTKIEAETAKIGAALRALSSTSRRKQLRNKNVRTRYRIIDVDHILAWSDRHNIGDREVILATVGLGEPPTNDDDGPLLEDFGSVPPANDERTPF